MDGDIASVLLLRFSSNLSLCHLKVGTVVAHSYSGEFLCCVVCFDILAVKQTFKSVFVYVLQLSQVVFYRVCLLDYYHISAANIIKTM